MTWILVARNPRSQRLVAVTVDGDSVLVEFDSEDAAAHGALDVPICKAWGFEVVEVTLARRRSMTP